MVQSPYSNYIDMLFIIFYSISRRNGRNCATSQSRRFFERSSHLKAHQGGPRASILSSTNRFSIDVGLNPGPPPLTSMPPFYDFANFANFDVSWLWLASNRELSRSVAAPDQLPQHHAVLREQRPKSGPFTKEVAFQPASEKRRKTEIRGAGIERFSSIFTA